MEEEEEAKALHFTLHLDKPLPCLVEFASWNPEKDLLAMVSSDHQVTVHRFNWQRLWAITPEKKVTTLCWRPDGKALAAGREDGKITIHDVENGEILRTIETHILPIQCLYWVEEKITQGTSLLFEDRTPRFFPPAPKAPVMPGTGSGFDMVDAVASGEGEQSAHQNAASNSSPKHMSILCSGDSAGRICLNAYGAFPIARLSLQDLAGGPHLSPLEIVLSSNLCDLTLVCDRQSPFGNGLCAISVDTTLLSKRHKEIRQVSLQASSIEELLNVLRASLAVMRKSWSDAISMFFDKFNAFRKLLYEHGSSSSPRDELLSLLACGSASASLHQFLAVTLGEAGLKRLAKSIDTAGKEVHNIIAEHLQPAAELVAFRIGELIGISRWRSHLEPIGLNQELVEDAMENAGMLLVQVERFLHIVSDSVGQFRLFFVWLSKSLRQLNGELPTEQGFIDSALVAAFLKSQFEHDPVGPHLNPEGFTGAHTLDKLPLCEELSAIGGFADTKFLLRTLSHQLDLLFLRCQSALSMPVSVITPRLFLKRQLLLSDLPSINSTLPALSLTCYETKTAKGTESIDYTCFQCTDGSNCVGILRGFSSKEDFEVAALQLEGSLNCVDLSLYKERQLLLLLTEKSSYDGNDQAWIMVLQLDDLRFVPLDKSTEEDAIQACSTNGALAIISLQDGKSRCIPQLSVLRPLAVSASRGLACVFATQRRALLYDLEEDEDEKENEAT